MSDAGRSPLELSDRQRLLLDLLLQEEGLAPAASQVIPRRKGGDLVPLSYTQEPLWILDQLNPGSTAYNIIFPLEFKERVDVDVLDQAINRVVERHEALRSTVVTMDGRPFQRVTPTLTITSREIEFRDLDANERPAAITEWIRSEAATPFDLASGPLFRTSLVHIADEHHMLVLSLHHIVCDTWSVGLLNREIRWHYRAILRGQPLTLPELSIQFGDFAIWQRQQLQGDLLEDHLHYWRRRLVDLPVLRLATDKPSPAVRTFPADRYTFVIGDAVTDALKELSRREGVTLYMTLLAAFNVLLARHSGQSDIVVGSPNANRSLLQLEGVIGFFTSPLLLRTDLSGNPPFTELLARVREEALEAHGHQAVPFQKLLQEAGPQRSNRRTDHLTLFPAFFSLQNIEFPELELSKLSSLPESWVRDPHPTAKFDLYLNMIESAGELIGTLEYDTDLFEHSTITRMAGQFETLLNSIAAAPSTRIGSLSILTDAERNQVLVRWNDTAVDCPEDLCFHRLFEAQAEQTPDSVAVVADQTHLTYRSLNRRANQIAHHLQARGVGPETVAALCVDRSADMAAGVLGILKAGGACLPLDPAMPDERLAFMLKDSRVPAVLTSSSLCERLTRHGVPLICLDRDAIAAHGHHDVPDGPSPENAAFVFYTSGSTGSPCGVVISHRSGCHGQIPATVTHRLAADDCLLLTASLSSARLLGELFWPWFAGAKVVVAAPGTHQDSGRLVATIAEQRVTVFGAVPSMLRVFLDEPNLSECASLRAVLSVGEALPADLQERFHARLLADLHNCYAQTEACPLTFWKCDRRSTGRPAPIGRPAANTQVYLLDSYLEPVPVRSAGEIHVGGRGLARGYLNHPELTARKFIPHPFGNRPGDRLYRNGDLGRYLADGTIEFAGRVDYQVKIGGNRIELEEIEAVLTQHARVREAAVTAREDGSGHLRLVAYVVPDDDGFSAAEVRRVLKARLPEYMVPSIFVQLERLPLTATGKVDRRALPAPQQGRPSSQNAAIRSRNPIEQALADLWSDVLAVDTVGIHDDFFDLGGHSLLAIQLVHRVRQLFQIELPLRTFLSATSVARLAAVIQEMLLNDIEQMSDEEVERASENTSTQEG